MVIVYKEELDMIHDKSIISERVDFDPEIYIYIQKLMKEQNKSFNEMINELIREHAVNSLCKRMEYIPFTQPIITPSINPYPFWDPNKVTYTCDSSDDCVNTSTTNNSENMTNIY